VLARRKFGCFSCHREHTGKYGLARVEDSFCVGCHRDLRTNEGPSQRFAQAIDSFANHPEFAISSVQKDPNSAVDDAHLLHLVAEPSVDGRGWADKSTIHFPHDKHLSPAGVMVPASHPLAENERGQLKVLTCVSCHVTADDGRYMKPVTYEQHCAACHPLAISKTLLGPIPHETPMLIQGMLRDRLMDYARQHPEIVSRDKDNIRSRLPNQRARKPSPRDVWQWIDELLTKPPDKETLSLAKRIEWACAYCHTTTATENGDRLLPFTIEPTRIPKRWWGHASFRHDRHDVSIMDCADCHAARDSSSANDILLPSIEDCQTCHAPLAAETRGGARHDCVACHGYHTTLHVELPPRFED
jgi:predicted CXXCH cytochrome family protein